MSQRSDDKFSLTLRGEGISIDREVDKRTALAIVAAALGGEGVTARAAPSHATDSSSLSATKSLREFLTEVAPNTNNERIVTIGSYLHEYRSHERFSKDDIEAGFRSAREQLPKNLSRDLSRTLAAGWIDEVGEKGRYHVTNTGAKAVQGAFGRQRQTVA